VLLNAEVRSILPDDEDRLAGANVYNDKDSGPKIAAALKLTTACWQSGTCAIPAYDSATRTFLKANPYYEPRLTEIDTARDLNKQRAAQAKLIKDLEADADRYEFRKNASVKRTSPNRLRLPLDPGPLGEVKPQLAHYIESMWSSTSLSLEVEWTSPTAQVAELYRFFIEPGTGGRSWVDSTKKEVHLFSDVKSASIAHEIGHTLGFRDTYYNVWRPERCEYVTQYDEKDLMSNPATGAVTAEHWNMLAEQYR
jgi:hypothetical protein